MSKLQIRMIEAEEIFNDGQMHLNEMREIDRYGIDYLFDRSIEEQVGRVRIHGHPSRVRVGRGCI